MLTVNICGNSYLWYNLSTNAQLGEMWSSEWVEYAICGSYFSLAVEYSSRHYRTLFDTHRRAEIALGVYGFRDPPKKELRRLRRLSLAMISAIPALLWRGIWDMLNQELANVCPLRQVVSVRLRFGHFIWYEDLLLNRIPLPTKQGVSNRLRYHMKNGGQMKR